jgi:hypothetical protein
MQKHITVSVDETVYRQARMWAAERDSSISAVVQYLLERLPRLPVARGFHAPNPRSVMPAAEKNSLPEAPQNVAPQAPILSEK